MLKIFRIANCHRSSELANGDAQRIIQLSKLKDSNFQES